MNRVVSFGRQSSRDDLAEYRAGYPGRNDDANATANIRFYRHEVPMMPDRVLVDDFLSRAFGRYDALEAGHSYIQFLFPVRDISAFNPHAQPLQQHEIAAMVRDGAVMRRVFRALQLMMDFYGFEVVAAAESPAGAASSRERRRDRRGGGSSCLGSGCCDGGDDDVIAAPAPPTPQRNVAPVPSAPPARERSCEGSVASASATQGTSKAVLEQQRQQWQQQQQLQHRARPHEPTTPTSDDATAHGDDVDPSGAGAGPDDAPDATAGARLAGGFPRHIIVQRMRDDRTRRQRFQNLLRNGHNNLRITRILKCLGELGLEAAKLAVVEALRVEVCDTRELEPLRTTLASYWAGTVYSDAAREALVARCAGTARC